MADKCKTERHTVSRINSTVLKFNDVSKCTICDGFSFTLQENQLITVKALTRFKKKKYMLIFMIGLI